MLSQSVIAALIMTVNNGITTGNSKYFHLQILKENINFVVNDVMVLGDGQE